MGTPMRYQPQGRVQFASGIRKPCGAFVAGPTGLRIVGDGKHDQNGLSNGPSIVFAAGPGGYAARTKSSSTDTVRLNALADQFDTVWEKPTMPITVLLVFRRFGNPGGTSILFGNQSPNTAPYTAWALEDLPSGYARFELSLNNYGNPTALTSSVLIPNNQLVVLIGRYDGAKMDIWQNGAVAASTAASGSILYPDASDRGPSVNNYYNYTGQARSAQIESYMGALWDSALSDADMARYSANPWSMWDSGSRNSAYQAAIVAPNTSTPANISAGTGTQADNGQTAAITSPVNIATAVGAASDAGKSAAITSPANISANTGSAMATGQGASVTNAAAITASTGQVSDAGQGATIITSAIITAGSGSMADAGQSATVSSGAGISAGVGSVSDAGQGAAVISTTAIAAGSGSEALAGQGATITNAAGITANTGAMSDAGQGAGITSPSTITAGAGSASAAGLGATVSNAAGISAGTGNSSSTGQAAAVVAPTVITTSAGIEKATGQSATVGQGSTVSAGVGALSDTGQGATISNGSGINAGTGAVNETGKPATITAVSNLSFQTANVIMSGNTATITTTPPPRPINPAMRYVGARRIRSYPNEDYCP